MATKINVREEQECILYSFSSTDFIAQTCRCTLGLNNQAAAKQ